MCDCVCAYTVGISYFYVPYVEDNMNSLEMHIRYCVVFVFEVYMGVNVICVIDVKYSSDVYVHL